VIAIDVAATALWDRAAGAYRLAREGRLASSDEMIAMAERWVDEFPVVSIEMRSTRKTGRAGSADRELGARVRLIGDDLFTTRLDRLRHGIEAKAANGVLVKLNQNGTLSGTLDVVAAARAAGYAPVISARSGETEDPFIADLGGRLAAGQIKIARCAAATARQVQPVAAHRGRERRTVRRHGGDPAVRVQADPATPDPRLGEFLREQGLLQAGEGARFTPLAGGVSSDIWRVELPDGRTICIKRALPKLKVAAEWHAPVSRNASEWAWIGFAARHAPAAVPRPAGARPAAGLFAMEYLSPRDHPVWKQQLLDGQVDPATAAAVGRVLATLHLASSRDAAVERSFDTGANFPPCGSTRTCWPRPACIRRWRRRSKHWSSARRERGWHWCTRRQPEDILVGPQGRSSSTPSAPGTATAFDVAFCLNHLLLKCLVRPDKREWLRRSFEAFVDAYFARAGFEPRIALESRAASLLPGLLLARVDGKSPVEYLRAERDRELVRQAAAPMVLRPPAVLAEVLGRWHHALAASG